MVKITDKREQHSTLLTQLCTLLRRHGNVYEFYENHKEFPIVVWKNSDNGPYKVEVSKISLENDSKQTVILIIEDAYIHTWPESQAKIPIEEFEDDTVSILIDTIGD